MAAPTVDVDRTAVTEAVQQMYTDVAACPTKQFHFPTGRTACLFVGYEEEEIDALPASAVESFAGVGYPFKAAVMGEAQSVVDIGSGSGTDLLIAANRVGPAGRVIGIDLNESMAAKAEANLAAAGIDYAEIRLGEAEDLPLEDASVDVVTSNGVINLVPDKQKAFDEIWRVLKRGGQIQIADITVSRAVSEKSRANPELWAECIVGAELEDIYLEAIRAAGFENIQVIDRMDYFSGSPSENTRKVAGQLGAHTVVLKARKR